MAADGKPQWLHPISLVFVFASGIRRHLIPALAVLFSATTGSWIGGSIALAFFVGSMIMAVLQYVALRYRLTDDELIVDEGVVFRMHRTVPIQRIQNIDLLQNPFHRLFGVAEVRVETASGTEPEAILRVLSLADVESLRSRVFARKEAFEQSFEQTRSAETSSQAALPIVAAQTASNPTIAPETVASTEPPVAFGQRTDLHGAFDQPKPALEPPEMIVALPLRLLVLAGLASDRGTVLFFVGLGVVWQQLSSSRDMVKVRAEEVVRYLPENIEGIVWLWIAIALMLGLFVVLKGLSIVWTVLRFYGYTLERAGDDLRVRCGLLTRVSATVRRNRIQFISVHRTLTGRWLRIASIRIETAGGGNESEDPASSIARQWFLPVIQEQRVAAVIEHLSPGLSWDELHLDWKPLSGRAVARMRRRTIALAGAAVILSAVLGWTSGVIAACLLGLFGWWWAKRRAQSVRYARTDRGVFFRSGIFTKKCSMAFIEKIQSIKVVHDPFDRRWQMGTLSVDTVAAGPAEHTVKLPMLDLSFAQGERDHIAKLASAAVIGTTFGQPVAGSQMAN